MPDYSRQVNSTLIWKQCKNLAYSYIRPQTRCKAQLWVLGCDGDKYLARRDSRPNVNEWSQELVAETILSFSARGLIQKVNIILEESTIWCIFIETQGGERLKGCILTCTYDYCNTAQKVIRFYKNVAKISYNVSFNRWRLISQRKSYPRPFFCEFFHRSWMISFRHFHILKLHHLYYSLMRSCCQSLGPMHCNGFMYHSHKAIVMALFCIIFIGCWPLSRPWRADYFGCFRFHHNRCDSGWYQITTSEQIILMPNKNNNINNCFYHQNNDNWCQLTATMAKNNFLCFVSIILKTFLVYVR